MKVHFALRAILFLRSEQSYIARFNKPAARAAIASIRKAAAMLGDYPHAGALVTAVSGVRRYTAAPYHIDYIIEKDSVIIVSIRHGRQQDPDMDVDEDDDFEVLGDS